MGASRAVTDFDRFASALAPAYRLERELGGGGMARVFVATEVAFNRRVAIKVVPVDGGAQAVDRFRREISTAAGLQHPHIVPVLTAGEADGVPWFSMPYVAGESLRARIAGQGALPLAEAIKILRDVAQALAYAHAQGFVHRDIKPDNVLLADGAAVVTDFGVAKALSSATNASNNTQLTAVGMALGTPAYMAPEQVSADPQLDHRADIYAWGCLAYELLTGVTPFGHRAPSAVYAAHLTETPKPVRATRAEIPDALARLIERCLEKDPAHRPQSAREIATALDTVVTTDASKAITTASRPRIVAILVGVVLLVSGAWWWRGHDSTPVEQPTANTAQSNTNTPRSLAILPFENTARDTSLDYLAEGLSDEVRTQLTGATGLSVRGRGSSILFADKGLDPRTVGEKLEVSAIVSGSVRRMGNRIEVIAELLDVATGNALWSLSIVMQSADLVSVRDSVSRAVGRALQAKLHLTSDPSAISPGIRDALLRSRYAKARADYPRALNPLLQALDRDSMNAVVNAELVSVYVVTGYAGLDPADSLLKLAESALGRAQRSAPGSSATLMAESVLAMARMRFTEAYATALKAYNGDSSSVTLLGLVMDATLLLGRIDEYETRSQRLLELDPVNPGLLTSVQYVRLLRADYRGVLQFGARILEVDPQAENAVINNAIAYVMLGKLDSAEVAARAAAARGRFATPTELAMVLATRGKWQAVDSIRRVVTANRDKSNSPSFERMMFHLIDGHTEQAIDALQQSFAAREPLQLNFIVGCDPLFSGMFGNPRFEAVLRGYGITPCRSSARWPIAPRR